MTPQSIAAWLDCELHKRHVDSVSSHNFISDSYTVAIPLGTYKQIDIECLDGRAVVFSVTYWANSTNSNSKDLTRIAILDYCDPDFADKLLTTIDDLVGFGFVVRQSR